MEKTPVEIAAIEATKKAPIPRKLTAHDHAIIFGVIDALHEEFIRPTLDRLKALEGGRESQRQFVESSGRHILDLQRRIGEVEAEPRLRYEGIFDAMRQYVPGQTVTSDGSLWICRSINTGIRPGTAACWALAAKKGRDAR